MPALEAIVVVTRKTALEELIARFNTFSQAKFYIEQTAKQNPGVSAPSFPEYQDAHDTYYRSLQTLKESLPRGVKSQIIERTSLPNFQFSDRDLVITIGPDGLVINTAKYLTRQPILAINPDSQRIDGILTPFYPDEAGNLITRALENNLAVKPITMAKARLNDGQELYGVNDLFIGARTHISARYRIEHGNIAENHCSSGIIVSTGAGSTGWLSSIVGAAARFHQSSETRTTSTAAANPNPYVFDSSSDYLYFAVREPFVSKTSKAGLTFGKIVRGAGLTLTSQMPENGVIFSDGIEADFVQFNSGAVASIGVAERKANVLIR